MGNVLCNSHFHARDSKEVEGRRATIVCVHVQFTMHIEGKKEKA